MAINRGKPFEGKVQEQLEAMCPLIGCERLHDQVTGYINTSQNPSDFIVYKYPYQYYLECKTTYETSIGFDKLIQLDRIAERCKVKGVKGKFLIWFINHKETYYIDYTYIQKKIKENTRKSLNHNDLFYESQHNKDVVLVPATYPRIYGKYDFSNIFN